MEAFLGLTGHTPCPDPVAAHSDSLRHDPRYKQQLEASMQAAAAQGWGAPMPVQAPGRRGGAAAPGDGSVASAGSYGSSPAAKGGAWAGRNGHAAPAAAGGGGGRGPARAPPAAAKSPAAAAWGSPYLPNNPYGPSEDAF
jgi:hypothetical protein